LGGLLATSCLISEPLALDALQGSFSPTKIIDAELDSVVVAEIELGQIPLQMSGGDMLIDAINTALEGAEISLDGVGVDDAANVFLFAVFDRSMGCEVVADVGVGLGLVAHEIALPRNVARHDAAQRFGVHVRDMEGEDAALALDKGKHGLLYGGRQERFAFGLAPYVGFVNLDNPASATERLGEDTPILGHGFANAMAQKPCCFHAAAKHALNLPGRNAFLAGAHQVNDLQPQVQRQMRGFKDRAHPHRKGFLARIALVQARTGRLALQTANAGRTLAMRANGAIRPKPRFNESEGGFLVHKMQGVQNGVGHD